MMRYLLLNVSNINNKHLLHSPIKLLRGKFGKFKIDLDEDNKIIITIASTTLDNVILFAKFIINHLPHY